MNIKHYIYSNTVNTSVYFYVTEIRKNDDNLIYFLSC